MSRRKSVRRSSALCLLLSGALASWATPGSTAFAAGEDTPVLQAGAATSNITPWLGLSINGGMRDRTATHIHDELHARCLVLDDGKTRLAIVAADSCMIPREILDAAKKRVNERIGLPLDHMLMCATHAHSAPAATGVFQSEPDAEYRRLLERKLADAVLRAVNHLAPAKIGWGVGRLPQHVFNRRWKMKPGTIPEDPFGRKTDQVRMNPSPRGSPDLVEPAGPTDPRVLVLSVTHADGRPLAILANYALHYVGGVGGGHVSADYFGQFADDIQRLLGADRQDPPFVAMLTNGASGDINNIDFREPGVRNEPYEQIRRVAGDLAQEVLRVRKAIEHRDAAPLGVRQTVLELAVRRPSKEEIAAAQEILAAAEGLELERRPEIYARETVLLGRYPEKVSLVLQALRIGDVAVGAIPCEVFVEIGLELEKSSPFPTTFVFELANGYNGYLPTVKQHELGGYETWRARSSYLEVEAAPKIVRGLSQLLAELKN
ncbi:MAG: hypothetical protein O7J95_08720 [Planctomycetota bacterium]|nr:hypothetical protein [Planctomycetota bacterium]